MAESTKPRAKRHPAPGRIGLGPLRDWVAAELAGQGMKVHPDQVLITSRSQQGLDLVGKVLIDAGSHVAVESPTYVGALQAFAPFEPTFITPACDGDGPLPEGLDRAFGARFLYVLPNFQNPSGRLMSGRRRDQLVNRAWAASRRSSPRGSGSATWWRPGPLRPSCCRPSRRPTSTLPGCR